MEKGKSECWEGRRSLENLWLRVRSFEDAEWQGLINNSDKFSIGLGETKDGTKCVKKVSDLKNCVRKGNTIKNKRIFKTPVELTVMKVVLERSLNVTVFNVKMKTLLFFTFLVLCILHELNNLSLYLRKTHSSIV